MCIYGIVTKNDVTNEGQHCRPLAVWSRQYGRQILIVWPSVSAVHNLLSTP